MARVTTRPSYKTVNQVQQEVASDLSVDTCWCLEHVPPIE